MAVAVATCLSGLPALPAQAQSVQQVVAANAGNTAGLTQALLTILSTNPRAAAQVCAIANANPQQLTTLAEALAQAQAILVSTNPTAATTVSNIVQQCSPQFQAAYAVAFADAGPGFTGGPGTNLTILSSLLGAQSSSGGSGCVSPSSPKC